MASEGWLTEFVVIFYNKWSSYMPEIETMSRTRLYSIFMSQCIGKIMISGRNEMCKNQPLSVSVRTHCEWALYWLSGCTTPRIAGSWSSSLVSVLFREAFSHPYISFFHLLVNGFSVIIIIIIIIRFFRRVFSECTEAITNHLHKSYQFSWNLNLYNWL